MADCDSLETTLMDWARLGDEGMSYDDIALVVVKEDGENPKKQSVHITR